MRTRPEWMNRYSNLVVKKCLNCGQEFEVPNFLSDKQKFCSRNCSIEDQKKRNWNPMDSEQARLKSSISHTGKHNSSLTEFKKGEHNSPSTEIKKGQHLSSSTEFKKGRIPWNKSKPYLQLRGKNHPNWKGGKSKYRGSEWERIRKIVWERDDFTCQHCGVTEVRLHAHHIVPYRISKNNVFDNLITLCTSCHTKADASVPYCHFELSVALAGEILV